MLPLSAAFWSALGGKREYQTSRSLQNTVKTPRLFGCSNKTGRLIVSWRMISLLALYVSNDTKKILSQLLRFFYHFAITICDCFHFYISSWPLSLSQAEEVPGDFNQSDLATDDVMLLDTWEQVGLCPCKSAKALSCLLCAQHVEIKCFIWSLFQMLTFGFSTKLDILGLTYSFFSPFHRSSSGLATRPMKWKELGRLKSVNNYPFIPLVTLFHSLSVYKH